MYKFIKEPTDNQYDTVRVEHSFEDYGTTLPDMLEKFEYFLKGCGFHIEGKVLDLVDENPTPIDEYSDEITIEVENSNLSFTIKKDQFIKLADLANKSDMTLNDFINKTLCDYMDKIEKEEEDA